MPWIPLMCSGLNSQSPCSERPPGQRWMTATKGVLKHTYLRTKPWREVHSKFKSKSWVSAVLLFILHVRKLRAKVFSYCSLPYCLRFRFATLLCQRVSVASLSNLLQQVANTLRAQKITKSCPTHAPGHRSAPLGFLGFVEPSKLQLLTEHFRTYNYRKVPQPSLQTLFMFGTPPDYLYLMVSDTSRDGAS